MPLPAIAAGAARVAGGAARGIGKGIMRAGRGLARRRAVVPGGGEDRKGPSVFSPEGIVMLALAGFFEMVNVVLGFLDIVLGIGTLFAPLVNGFAMAIIGGWVWLRTGKVPIRKALFPFIGNSLPLIRFFPFWLWSVWTSLSKGGESEQPQSEEQGPQEVGASA